MQQIPVPVAVVGPGVLALALVAHRDGRINSALGMKFGPKAVGDTSGDSPPAALVLLLTIGV